MSNKTYDVLKWFVLIFLPALSVLVAGIGELYGLEDYQAQVTLINLFATFLGTILQISSQQYYDDSQGGANHVSQ